MKISKLGFLFAALVLIGGLTGCSDDDEPAKTEDEINLSDVDAVSESLKFKNVSAVSKEGQLPEASTDANAPKLRDEGDNDITSISGSDFVLELNPESYFSALKGVYFQIDGAKTYYDISLEVPPADGRQKAADRDKNRRFGASARVQEFMNDILVSLPKELSAGEFCFSFAAYDTEGRVSNYVNACVEVLKAGGDGSNFLTANQWEVVYWYDKEVYDGQVYEDTDSVGVLNTNTYTTVISCNEGPSSVEVTEKWGTNYLYLTFKADGEVLTEGSDYEKHVDYQNSFCDELVYLEGDEEYTASGVWSYDSKTKKLRVAVEYRYEDEQGNEVSEIEVNHYEVEELSGGMLKLTEEEEFTYPGDIHYSFYSETYIRAKK